MAVEATAVSATSNKAGFWIRTFAYLIDAIGIGIVSGHHRCDHRRRRADGHHIERP